eukprot:8102175-Pyramimonas_sp.AAC.1
MVMTTPRWQTHPFFVWHCNDHLAAVCQVYHGATTSKHWLRDKDGSCARTGSHCKRSVCGLHPHQRTKSCNFKGKAYMSGKG